MNDWCGKIGTATPLAAFLITLAVMPLGIGWLKRLNFGQNIREDGPEAHKGKAGTPTMGGIVFVPVALVFGLTFDLLMKSSMLLCGVIIALFTVGGLLIGWLDDYRSIKLGKSLGLKAREKLVMQFILSAAFLFAFHYLTAENLSEPNHDIGSFSWVRTWWHYALLALISVWIINSANIADGLDGLAASQGVVAIISIIMGGILLHPLSQQAFAPLVMTACLLAFLCFNAPPARVFMGDTGSIALGCFIVGYGMITVPLWLLFLATAMWSIESLSVVAQVLYFKLTGGSRIFRMAPVHHHFELCGWPETTVTFRFVAVSIVFGFFVPLAILGFLQ